MLQAGMIEHVVEIFLTVLDNAGHMRRPFMHVRITAYAEGLS